MQRFSAHGLSGLLACTIWVVTTPAAAGPTATFEIDSFKELDKGKPDGALISSAGEVLPGLGSQKVDGVEATMIWSRARGSDGAVYFGTADKGQILRVKGKTVRVVAQLDTILVTALAWTPRGKLLAATMPGARVLEVDPGSGKWRQLAKLPAEHIWALLYHRRRGRIYAATGAPAKIFELRPGGGKPAEYFASKDKHLLCLAQDSRGNLLTGGSDKAILYRVSGAKRASAVHDFAANELRAVTAAKDGTIHVVVNKFPRKEGGIPRFDKPEKGKEGTALDAKPSKSGKSGKQPALKPQDLRPGAKKGQGALYRIGPKGRVEQLLALPRGYFTDLARDDQGTVWAADGAAGKVYSVRGRRAVTTLFDFKERQVLALAVAGEQRYLGTGDGGAIYRVLPRPTKAPAYESKVLDAKFPASWGVLHYRASAPLRVFSRGGNTAKPDETWSAWSAGRTLPGSRVKLGRPSTRYLQIKTTWPRKTTGALRSLKLYYRPLNQRGRLTDISFERKRSSKDSTNSKIKLKWKVENPDKDKLVYRLSYREELGSTWRRIKTGDAPLTKTSFEWDTEGIADDTYRVRIVASDESVNGAATTLTDSRTSAPILIDNRRPDITGLGVRFPWATGLAKDSYSPIKSIELAVDGGNWRSVDPTDGIFDSPSEAFRIMLPTRLERGPHVVAIRVRDEAGNVGVRQVRFLR